MLQPLQPPPAAVQTWGLLQLLRGSWLQWVLGAWGRGMETARQVTEWHCWLGRPGAQMSCVRSWRALREAAWLVVVQHRTQLTGVALGLLGRGGRVAAALAQMLQQRQGRGCRLARQIALSLRAPCEGVVCRLQMLLLRLQQGLLLLLMCLWRH